MALAGAGNPDVAPYKKMLDSVSLTRSGPTITGRVTVSSDLLKLFQ
jgi:hypothetical protein